MNRSSPRKVALIFIFIKKREGKRTCINATSNDLGSHTSFILATLQAEFGAINPTGYLV
jgi:hypothetical protein